MTLLDRNTDRLPAHRSKGLGEHPLVLSLFIAGSIASIAGVVLVLLELVGIL